MNRELPLMNIVITGASKGIGRAIARQFGANGYALFLCARNENDLRQISSEISSANPDAVVHIRACDVSVKDQLGDFAEWVLSSAANVDVLVNNAGTFIQGNVYDEADGALEHLMATNLYSAYYLSRYLIPSMIARKRGHIFNICSIASLKAYKQGGSYSITKYAMDGLSANLRDELKEFNIKVTSVYPGAVYTDSWSSSGISEERIMKAEDIAQMIFTSAHLSPQACVEEIVMRPQLGDL